MNRQILKQAFMKSLPILAGYLVLGFGFGVLLQEKTGYGWRWALVIAVTMYAGSMQYVGVGILASGASIITAILTTLMVNARHLFYAISMLGVYKGAGKYKPYLAFSLTDETYSLLCDGQTPEGQDPQLFRFLVSFFNQCYWIAGCVLGNVLASSLPFPSTGIEFSMTALFIAAFTEQWITMKDHLPALTGAGATLLCLLMLGPEKFLIPAMLLITLILTLLRGREEAAS